MTTYNIGDYIEYFEDYYNGRGGYSTSTNYGCIISKNTADRYCNVIKQYGGEIWYGVKPSRKITEEEFLSNFSIYDEHKDFLLKELHVLPPSIQPVIITKIEQKLLKNIKSMILFCLLTKINYKLLYPKTCTIEIHDEVWAIKWYIINVLRKYEPFKIRKTLELCCGATKLIKEFMFNNINFMVSMQFQPYHLEHIMHLLIQEKWLEFIYEKKLISSTEYSARIFPITIKKMEAELPLCNWNTIYETVYGIKWGSHKWISSQYDSKWKDKIIINNPAYRSLSPNCITNIRNIINENREDCIFISNEPEHYIHFSKLVGTNVEYYKPKDFEETVAMINSCEYGIFGFSSFAVIANGLHKSHYLIGAEWDDSYKINRMKGFMPNILDIFA